MTFSSAAPVEPDYRKTRIVHRKDEPEESGRGGRIMNKKRVLLSIILVLLFLTVFLYREAAEISGRTGFKLNMLLEKFL